MSEAGTQTPDRSRNKPRRPIPEPEQTVKPVIEKILEDIEGNPNMDILSSPDAAPEQVVATVAKKVEQGKRVLQEQQRSDRVILAKRATGATHVPAEARSDAMEDFQAEQATIQERGEAAEAELVYDENANPEASEHTVDAIAAFWRDPLSQVEGTLFASFAKSRLGKQLLNRGLSREQLPPGFKEFPGDLDAFVPDQRRLEIAYKILADLGAEFTSWQNEKPFKKLSDGSLLLAGEIEIPGIIHRAKNGSVRPFRHEFEIFVQASERVIGERQRGMRMKTDDGLWILNDEALVQQYGRNLRMESEVGTDTRAVADAFRENKVSILADLTVWESLPEEVKVELHRARREARKGNVSLDFTKLADTYGMSLEEVQKASALDEAYEEHYSPEEIRMFYMIEDVLEAAKTAGDGQKEKYVTDEMTRLLSGGWKDKTPKRSRDLNDLQQTGRIEIASPPTEASA